MIYQKRARRGWCCGKGYKKIANKNERQYEKEEIKEELKQVEQGEEFKYKHKPKKKKLTEEQRIEKQLKYYEHRLDYYNRPNMINTYKGVSGWIHGIVSRFKDKIKKLKEKSND